MPIFSRFTQSFSRFIRDINGEKKDLVIDDFFTVSFSRFTPSREGCHGGGVYSFSPCFSWRGSGSGTEGGGGNFALYFCGSPDPFLFAQQKSGESHRPLTPDTFEKYRDTPPVSIAILLHKYALFLAQRVVYTPPICITIRLPFASRYSCRSIRVRGRWNTAAEREPLFFFLKTCTPVKGTL